MQKNNSNFEKKHQSFWLYDQSVSSGYFAKNAGRHHVCGESPRDGRTMEEIPLPVDTDAPGRECRKETVVFMHGIDRICGIAAVL